MSSLIPGFATIAGSIREKTKMGITRPPLKGYLSEISVWAREHVLTTGGKKSFTSILCHFKEI